MSTHLVAGAGPVGRSIARCLVAAGHEVLLISRSGRGAGVRGAKGVAADVADTARLATLARGCDVIYNALNPPHYHRWTKEWPPMWSALRTTAEDVGAVLATVGNLYGYGRVEAPMSEDTPVCPAEDKGRIRARMWQEALDAHRAGRLRALEVRGSDYLGAGVEGAVTTALRATVVGRTARVIGGADVPHSWTYTGDVARVIVAAAADPAAHGRVWHVPSNPPCTQRELLGQLAGLAGVEQPKITILSERTLRLIGLFDRPAGAAATIAYQFSRPFVLDDAHARRCFGLDPTPWPDILAETVADLTRSTRTAPSSPTVMRTQGGAR